MKRSKIFLLSLLLLIPTLIVAQDENVSLDDRGYGLYIPSSYDDEGTEALPLLIALHSFGDTWRNFAHASGLVTMAEQRNLIVAFPQGYLRQWSDGSVGNHYEDDVQLLRDLIARVQRDYRIDEERIYLVGFSNGGTMVFKAACEAPELFAGVVSVGGTMRVAQQSNCAETQVPVAIIHGTADQVVPFAGDPYRLSADEGVIFWATQNECNLETLPPYSDTRFRDGFAMYLYTDCPDGNYVLLHAIEDGAHTWFGASAYIRNASPQPPHTNIIAIMWSFFELSYEAHLNPEVEIETTPEVTQSP